MSLSGPKSGQLAQLPLLLEDSKNLQVIMVIGNSNVIIGNNGNSKNLQVIMVIGLIGHSWGHLDSSNHVYPHLAI